MCVSGVWRLASGFWLLTPSAAICVCGAYPGHVGPRTTFSVCDDIYNQVPRASNHMHLVQLSLLYIPKGIRLKGHSFYKIHNGVQTTMNNQSNMTQPVSTHMPRELHYNHS